METRVKVPKLGVVAPTVAFTTPLVEFNAVKVPAAGVVPPMTELLIVTPVSEPDVIATLVGK